MRVFFLRGLSTYGRDNAKWAFLDFGPMHRHFAQAFKDSFDFIPVTGMGAGPFPEMADRARQFIVSHPAWQAGEPIHLLGHSAGGLVARLLLHELEKEPGDRVRSLLTLATPHRGSRLAEICLNMQSNAASSAKLLRILGYDIHTRLDFFERLTPAAVAQLVGHHTSYRAQTASVVCWEERSEWCWPLKLMHKLKAFKDYQDPSDGFVERDSQAFGEPAGEVRIDHLRQIGLFQSGEPRFENLCRVVRYHYAGLSGTSAPR